MIKFPENKIIPCPICSREIDLFFLRDIRVFYSGCPHCKINIFMIGDTVAWVKEYSERGRWFFKFTKRYWATGMPKLPFELHLLIKDADVSRVTKITDLIFTLYKKMWMGYQVPLDARELADENEIQA
jgi:hypothetical protein